MHTMKNQPVLTRITLVMVSLLLLGIWLWQIPHSLEGVPGAYGFTVCHQIRSHAFTVDMLQFPLCARCTGLYLGALFGLIFFLKVGKKAGLPSKSILIVMLGFFFVWAGDGLNAFVHDYFSISLYTPSNLLRYITGSAMGVTLSFSLLSVLNATLWKDWQPTSIVVNLTDVLLPFAITLITGGLFLVQSRTIFMIVAYIAIATVILVITLLHANIWILLLRKENIYTSWHELSAMLMLGFCTAQAQFILMATARLSLTGNWIIY